MNEFLPNLRTYHCPSCGAPFQVDPSQTRRHTCQACGSQHKFKGRVEKRAPRRAVAAPPVAASVSEPMALAVAMPDAGEAHRLAHAHRHGPPKVGGSTFTGWLGSALGNVIWVVFGGGIMALGYWITGLANMLTIIGIPPGWQCLKLGIYSLWPFGNKIESSEMGCLWMPFNLLWFFTGGLWLALGHLCWALLLLLPIVTWPFAFQHFKLAELAIFPFGRRVVPAT